MPELKKRYTIVIVTHNMQQAARVSDSRATFCSASSSRSGRPANLHHAPRFPNRGLIRRSLRVSFGYNRTAFSDGRDER